MSGDNSKYCYYCGHLLERGNPRYRPTKDHIIPKIKGGTDRVINLVDSCAGCNSLKGSLLPSEFLDFLTERTNKGYGHNFATVDDLMVILPNVKKVISERVEVHGIKLFRELNEPFTLRRASKKPKSLMRDYFERHAGDVKLSVNNNTIKNKDEILRLQRQTLDEFKTKNKK